MNKNQKRFLHSEKSGQMTLMSLATGALMGILLLVIIMQMHESLTTPFNDATYNMTQYTTVWTMWGLFPLIAIILVILALFMIVQFGGSQQPRYGY